MKATCWNCGYELAGLDASASCPECGIGRPWLDRGYADRSEAVPGLALSLASLIFLGCAGPFAILLAAPALVLCTVGLCKAMTRRLGRLEVGISILGIACAMVAIAGSTIMSYMLLFFV